MGRIGGALVMRYGYLFPGQGSQFPGMGRDLAEMYPEARKVFEDADLALGFSLSDLCWNGTEEQLALTENTQPAILTHSVATLRVLESLGAPAPEAAAGHSLGEYSAHVAAGTLDFTHAVRTVRDRGRYKQAAVSVGVGAMAAIIGFEMDRLEAVFREAAQGEVVSVANLNSPGQIVIAGHAGAVARSVELARDQGARKAVPLPVSAPFHCSLMDPAAESLEPVLNTVEMSTPSIPVFANVDAVPVRTGRRAREALLEQVSSPVLWTDVITRMIDAGVESFIEIGPGKVLSGLVKRIDRKTPAASVGDIAGLEKILAGFGRETDD
jgi:[acyl-carrier-protein] S-malonyltransferase